MLTALLLLTLAGPCPEVLHPELPAPRIEGMPVELPMRECEPSRGVAALMYSLGIDAAAPVEVAEVEADIFQEEP